MQLLFSTGADDTRYAHTDGLAAAGQSEIAVPLPWPERDPRDRQAADLLRFLEQSITTQSKRFLAGQTVRYGWTTLRFEQDDENLSRVGPKTLLVEELQDPFKLEEPHVYVPGASRALRLLSIQQAAIRRNNIAGEAEHPHRSKVVIICSRITPETLGSLRPLRVERMWKPDASRSGWFVACVDPDHDHDDDAEMDQSYLLHLVERCPCLLPYLGFPVGSLLIVDTDQVVVFGPNEQEGRIDSSPPLRSLPIMKDAAIRR